MSRDQPGRGGFVTAVALLLLTVGQLAVATFVPGLDQFAGKAFAARLLSAAADHRRTDEFHRPRTFYSSIPTHPRSTLWTTSSKS